MNFPICLAPYQQFFQTLSHQYLHSASEQSNNFKHLDSFLSLVLLQLILTVIKQA